jgi:hypothetical protein
VGVVDENATGSVNFFALFRPRQDVVRAELELSTAGLP